MGPLTPWLLGVEAVPLSPAERETHTYVIGQPGAGKSRALESWIMQDVKAGHGAGAVDPHGDVYQHLVRRVARLCAAHPELAERVILVDPCHPTWTIGFNPLEAVAGYSHERLASFLTDVVLKIWKLDAVSAPRLVRLLSFTLAALAELGLSLADLPRFLTDSAWRNGLVGRLRNPDAAGYFSLEFPQTPGAVNQWVTPVLNKIGALLFDPDIRLMFSARSTINFRAILDQGFVLLVNLSKGLLGEENSALLGAFFVAHLQKAALARAGGGQRRPFYLYLDEFQNYTSDNVKDILSESRKYGLSLILAHQYLEQLSADLRAAVLNTTGTIACFRVGYHDASLLAREIFPPGSMTVSHQDVKHVRFLNLALPYVQRTTESMEHEELTGLLTQLRAREFWVKRRGARRPVKLRSLDMPDPRPSDDLYRLRESLETVSGLRYGRRKSDALKEYEHVREQRRTWHAVSDDEAA